MRATFLACMTACAGVAQAVVFEFPGPAGFYQLQSLETWETLCETGDGEVCDVPPGEYTLLNFDFPIGTPNFRRRILIEARSRGESEPLVRSALVKNDCFDAFNCRAYCSDAEGDEAVAVEDRLRAIGGTCYARTGQVAHPILISITYQDGDDYHTCQTDRRAELVYVQVSCLAPTVR